MQPDRRLFVLSLAAVAACGKQGVKPASPALDTKLLDQTFPDLADRARPGDFNAGLMDLQSGQTWFWNAERRFPMQSVFKAPLGAAVLADVDAGRVRLAELVTLKDLDLSPGYSPIAVAWPTPSAGQRRVFSVQDLLARAVRDSDNTAADVLMRRIGGPGAVTGWLRNKEILDMRVDRYERELQQEVAGMISFRPEWKDSAAWLAARATVPPSARQAAMDAYLADPRDTTTVQDSLNFLFKLARGELISQPSTARLIKLMTDTKTGPGRLKAGLPKDASLAHKTGSSGTDLGFTPATNDIGIVTLKDARRYAIAGFLSGSTATEAERDRLFADTARLMVQAAR